MGKKSKLRACPALGREIGSAECGAGRHAAIACPAGCPHDLFAAANYDALLEAETRLDRRTTQALAAEVGQERVLRLIDAARARGGEPAVNAAMVRELFINRDAAGRSFAARWLAAGAPGLDKDERVFFAGKTRMRVVLFETLEVRADGLLRVRDLLEPAAGEILLLDRRGWARATRFQVSLVWAYPLPHYWRMCGGGMFFPRWSGCELEPAEILGELMAHAGGPSADAPLAERRAWLALHFEEMPGRIGAVSDARQREMWAGMDAVSVWSEYTLSAAEATALAARLTEGEAQEVYPCDLSDKETRAGFVAAYDACLSPEPGDIPGRRELLGRLLVRGSLWRIEATGRSRLALLKTRFFELVGVSPREPERELARDIARQQEQKIPGPDDAQVPPRLLENPDRFEVKSYRLAGAPDGAGRETAETITRRTLDQAQGRWLDTPVSALGGLSPRAAASSGEPALRTRLVRLLQRQLHDYDEACLRGKFLPDPQTLVVALGLTELDAPPPPQRARPPELAAEAEDVEEDGRPADGPGIGPPPPLRPLNEQEVIARLVRLQRHFPTDDELVDAWTEACPAWAEAVAEWGEQELSAPELDHLEVGLALAWGALGGADNPRAGIAMDGRKLRAAFASAWVRFDRLTTAAEIIAAIRGLNPGQPDLQIVIQIRLGLDANARKEGNGSLAEVYMALAAWLDAAVPELARA
jgi:hypothetical protein